MRLLGEDDLEEYRLRLTLMGKKFFVLWNRHPQIIGVIQRSFAAKQQRNLMTSRERSEKRTFGYSSPMNSINLCTTRHGSLRSRNIS